MMIENVGSRGILFRFTVPGGWEQNLYVIKGNTRNYLIDTGLGSEMMAPIKAHLSKEDKPLVVILTHHHWDHIWGLGEFAGHMIIAHQLCRKAIADQWEDMLAQRGEHLQGAAVMVLPNVVFTDTLAFPEDQLQLFYSPGHTEDSVSIWDEADRVLLLGDNIGDDREELVPNLYCEKSVYKQTLRRYEELDFDLCISGHNTILPKAIIGDLLTMLGDV